MNSLIGDIRFGFRVLVKSPLFTVSAVLCLGLGIGANAAMFTFFYAILIDPLPFEESSRLVDIMETLTANGQRRISVSYPDYVDWSERNHVFSSMAAYDWSNFTLTGGGDPERLQGAEVSHNLLDVLRVQPQMGRGFNPEDDVPGAPGTVLLSRGLWQRRFGADPAVLGQILTLQGEPYTVIGIMPEDFAFPAFAQLWVPFRLSHTENRGRHSDHVVGRLKRGISLERARTDMEAITTRLTEEYPDTNRDIGVSLRSLKKSVMEDTGTAVSIFLGVVVFILLLACANVANLLLARAAVREKEVAVRATLGAGRLRIVRQLLTESILLALMGGSLGLLLGRIGRDLIVGYIPVQIPSYFRFEMNAWVILILIGITTLSGVLFGIAPALASTRSNLTEVLGEGSGRTSGGSRMSLFRSFLVVLEICLALVVLTGAGLMMKGFLILKSVEPGFEPENVLTVRVLLPEERYEEDQERIAFYRDALDRVKALPGVLSAAAINTLPTGRSSGGTGFQVEGTESPPTNQRPTANLSIITPGYFETMDIPLLRGRYFTDRDVAAGAPSVVIVNETFAERYWPDEDPLGKRISTTGDPAESDWIEVVGVTGDVRHYGLDSPVRVGIYRPYTQYVAYSLSLVISTVSGPLDMVEPVRRAVWGVDPDLPLYQIRSMEQVIREDNFEQPLYTWLFGIFSVIALVLASVGVYGVVAYSVEQRTREFGIRMALGAEGRDVVRLVVGKGALLAVIGLGAGLAVAFLTMRFLGSILYGVSHDDPTVYGMATAAMAVVAVLASYLPARRATRVDPLDALRYE